MKISYAFSAQCRFSPLKNLNLLYHNVFDGIHCQENGYTHYCQSCYTHNSTEQKTPENTKTEILN